MSRMFKGERVEAALIATSFISGLLGLVMVLFGNPDWAAALFLGAAWLISVSAWLYDYSERWHK